MTRAALFVFLGALAVRLAFVLTIHPIPVSDPAWYYGRAIEILHGHGFSRDGHPTAYFPPGWPYFLAGILRVFGPSPVAGEIAQAILGALTAALVVVITERIAGNTAAIAGGIAYAFLPSAVEWTSTLETETLYTFLWALATAIWVRCSTRQLGWYALSGGLLGAAALVRPSALFFWVILFAYLITLPEERKDWRRLLGAVAVTACCTLIVVTPWMVRDYKVYNKIIVISNNGGVSLYQANNPLSNAGYSELYNPQIAALIQDPRTEAEGDALASQLAVNYMKSHVAREAWLSVLKVKALYSRDDGAITFSIGKTSPPPSRRVIASLFVLNMAWYYGLMLFAIGGIGLCFINRRSEVRPQWRIVFGMIVYNTLIFSIVGGFDRYRAPTMPYFSVFAGIGIAAVIYCLAAGDGTTRSSTSAKRLAQESPR